MRHTLGIKTKEELTKLVSKGVTIQVPAPDGKTFIEGPYKGGFLKWYATVLVQDGQVKEIIE